ncbi:hypothetical protein Tco_1515873 [Tanacetum coccineum]
MQIVQPSMNMGQDRQIQMIGGHGGNQTLGVHNVGNQNGLIVVLGIAPPIANQNANQNRNGNVVAARAEDNRNGNNANQIRWIQLQVEGFDLMAAAADCEEIEEVNVNYILMANLQQASISGTHADNAPVYDSDGSAEVHQYENLNNNEIFNMFAQEEQYTELLESTTEPHLVQ